MSKLFTDAYAYHYSQAEIETAVTEAKSAGLKETIHVQGGEAARNVAAGGAAVKTNPLDTIDAVKQTSFVMKEEKVIRKDNHVYRSPLSVNKK